MVAFQIHEGIPNLCYTHPQIKGDAKTALADSHAVVEEEFSTQLIHQSPLEPEAALAYLEEDPDNEEQPRLVVVGRSIFIHYHLKILQDALGWQNVRYQQGYHWRSVRHQNGHHRRGIGGSWGSPSFGVRYGMSAASPNQCG